MKRTALILTIILALLFSTIAGTLVDLAGANPYPYTNCGSSFVTVSVLSPENKTYETNSILVTIFAGAYPGVWYVGYSIDGGRFKTLAPEKWNGHTFNASVWLHGLSKGSHNIVAKAWTPASDPAEGVTAYSQVYFTVAKETEPPDTTAPEIILVSPENKTYCKTGIPLNFSVNELNCWVCYKLDAQDEIEISGNTTLSGFFYGSHSLTVYTTDDAGNTGAQTVVFTFAKPEETNSFSEPSPATFLIAIVVLVAVIGISLLLYFKKRNR